MAEKGVPNQRMQMQQIQNTWYRNFLVVTHPYMDVYQSRNGDVIKDKDRSFRASA